MNKGIAEKTIRRRLKPKGCADGLSYYTLSVPGRQDRTELLPAAKAAIRNTHRALEGYPGRWEPDKYARQDDLTSQPVEALTSKEWSRRFTVALRRDWQWYQTLRPTKELAMSKKEKAEKVEEKASDRPTWNGKAMTAVIRWCGKKGFNRQQTEAIMKHCDFVAAPATIHIQLGKGRHDENVPKFTKDEAEELKAIAAKVKDEKPAKKDKSKKDKSEKPAKKAKKEAEADAEADASDDDEESGDDEAEEAGDADDDD